MDLFFATSSSFNKKMQPHCLRGFGGVCPKSFMMQLIAKNSFFPPIICLNRLKHYLLQNQSVIEYYTNLLLTSFFDEKPQFRWKTMFLKPQIII